MANLPKGFEELEEFVAYWDVPTSHDRWIQRSGADYQEIVRFHDAMTARMEDATVYVEQYPLHDLPDDAACLFRLLLAMMQTTVAVEVLQAPLVSFAPWPHTLKISAGLQPYG